MHSIRKISIGTANFDKNYGAISSNKIFTINKINKILKESKKLKINTIDTSSTYGDVEKKLGNCNLKDWKVITKLPKLNLDSVSIEDQIFKYTLSSINRLNIKCLDSILVSDVSQIFSKRGDEIIKGLCKLKKEGITKRVGFSVYFPNETKSLLEVFTPDIIQIPYSVIDRRFEKNNLIRKLHDKNIKIYARSIFLQGILLTNSIGRDKYFDRKWKNVFRFWDNYISKNNLDPIEVCLSYVLKNKYIYKIVVGLNSKKKVENTIKVLNKKIIFPKNFCNDENLLIPYKWKIKSMKFYLSTLYGKSINLK
tara:strand:- start:55 stop:981 length:927 start_codon:yes stop_codon:yes gene_type:complete